MMSVLTPFATGKTFVPLANANRCVVYVGTESGGSATVLPPGIVSPDARRRASGGNPPGAAGQGSIKGPRPTGGARSVIFVNPHTMQRDLRSAGGGSGDVCQRHGQIAVCRNQARKTKRVGIS